MQGRAGSAGSTSRQTFLRAGLGAKFGVPLVERHACGVTLTAAGHRLHQHARAIIAALARAEGEVKAFSEEPAGPVSLGLSHTVTHRATLPLMRALKAKRPGIMLGLMEAMSVPPAGRPAARGRPRPWHALQSSRGHPVELHGHPRRGPAGPARRPA